MWSDLTSILKMEIFSIDGQPMSLGKFLMGLLLLAVVYIASGRMSNLIDRRVLRRFEVDNSVRNLIRSAIHYFFLAVGVLFVLRALNIPITIFTVIGGALAIGIGFGSQNVVNNFMSSIIVMIEKPVRVGDFIEVDGYTGIVEQIGIRSTHILSGMNQRVVIPNSNLIEKPMINWNLVDDWISSKVTIGVGYESDMQKVKNLLLQAAKDVQLDFPDGKSAGVNLVDFGDNAVIFDLFFWSRSRHRGALNGLQSQLRFRIWELFQEHQISIPFPQREITVKNISELSKTGSSGAKPGGPTF